MPPREATGFSAPLRDGPGRRAAGYLLLKLPVGLIEGYAAFLWVGGLFNLTYPLWLWPPLNARQHATVPVCTPAGWLGQGTFRVGSLPGAFGAFAAGAAMLLIAPWATRAMALTEQVADPAPARPRQAGAAGHRTRPCTGAGGGTAP